MEKVVTIGDGPLGMTIDNQLVVARVNPGSNAESVGISVNWTLAAVNSTQLSSMSYDDVIALIRAAPRPLSLTFRIPAPEPQLQEAVAPEVEAPAPEPPAPSSSEKAAVKPPLQPADGGKSARGGGFISGLLSGSKEVMRILSEKATLPPVPVVRLNIPRASDTEIARDSHRNPGAHAFLYNRKQQVAALDTATDDIIKRGKATNQAIERARMFVEGRCRDMVVWADGVQDSMPRLQHDIDAIETKLSNVLEKVQFLEERLSEWKVKKIEADKLAFIEAQHRKLDAAKQEARGIVAAEERRLKQTY